MLYLALDGRTSTTADHGSDTQTSLQTHPSVRADILSSVLKQWGERHSTDPRRVLVLPPDASRRHSFAGQLTRAAYDVLGTRLSDIMPTLGTHHPMSPQEIETMYEGVPPQLFRDHDWRHDLVELGRVPAAEVAKLSEGLMNMDWPVQLNRLVAEGGHDLILSIGQVLPHEIAGFANHSKNILIGAGGADAIHRSHYLGAVYGMERIMGRADNPVRQLFRSGMQHASHLPVLYLLTVVAPDEDGRPQLRGLFAGDDEECFERAAALSGELNITHVPEPADRVLAYMPEAEYGSTWLANKAIYRTRMAIADGGELTVVAPGVQRFGEDESLDRLIRRHGYRSAAEVAARVEADPQLAAGLSAAAHLIHGSSEGRFRIRYCAPGLGREAVEAVGYEYVEPDEIDAMESAADLVIDNPALGLWMSRARSARSSPP